MTAPFTKIAPDALTRFSQSDEQALERIFRSEYDSLTALAAAESGDPASSSRLVEAAFYEAWQQRGQFTSPGDLEFFLRRSIHQGALRAQGRRAALHHFTEREGGRPAAQPSAGAAAPLGVEEAWTQLAAALHASPASGERAAHMRRDLSRHETAEHMAHIGERRAQGSTIALMAAIAALVAIGIVVLVRALSPNDPVAAADRALASSEARLIDTRPGLRANVELADGSRASLGPDTHLRIPPAFGERSRAVGLVGTATFHVAPGNDRTFVVRAGSSTVTARGTVFDLSAYPGSNVIVRVREGSVEVLTSGPSRTLDAGQSVAVDADGTVTEPTSAALDEALGWTDGRFVVSDVPMRDLPTLLQRWYGMQVLVGDSAVLDRRISLDVPLDSSRQLISSVEQAGRVRYASRGETRVFRDGEP